MKPRKSITSVLTLALISVVVIMFSSCGRMHSYWGVHNDYYQDYDGGGRYYYQDNHGRHKPKPSKKHKKYKKHKRHHDDD